MNMVIKDWIHGAAGMMLLLIAVVTLLVVAGSVRWLLLRRRRQARAAEAAPAVSPEQERQRLDRIRRVAEEVSPPPVEVRPAVDWPITETVSVALRRRIPVQFDVPARSWLGGLPMLPDHIEWPRGIDPGQPEAAPRPLHFVAQIACADLPGDLWDGLGPRDGWLLFFCNANSAFVGHPETFRVLHTDEPGSEREPPADMAPVDDALRIGSPFRGWMAPEEVPGRWRRWPVDCVTLPNALPAEEADHAALLYPGEAVQADGLGVPVIEPFTWRPVMHGWDALGEKVGTTEPCEAGRQPLRDKLAAMGGPSAMLHGMVESMAAGHHAAPDAPFERAAREKLLERVAVLVDRYPEQEAFEAFLDRQEGKFATWLQGAPSRVAPLDDHIRSVEPDGPLEPAHWQDIVEFLKADRCSFWRLGWAHDGTVQLDRRTVSLWDWFEPEVSLAVPEVAGDYYTDPARRALIPDAALAVLEPWWRSLHGNRPHRLGGRHDGVQSVAEAGPTRNALLLQLASDPAMQWNWGDAGALYWFIGTGSLSAGRFGTATCHRESH